MILVAPATRLLTVLHVRTEQGGETQCGLPLLPDEVWLAVERGAAERICPACEGVPDLRQEALL